MSTLDALREYSILFLSKKRPKYERDLLQQINLKNKMIGIVGAKGWGKRRFYCSLCIDKIFKRMRCCTFRLIIL